MEKLFLGVSRRIITPEVGGNLYGYRPDVFSESVADDLTVTAFYFRQGDTQALMISATVCLIQTELAQRVISQISERLGIPQDSCIISATHTHSGPNLAGTVGWGDIDTEYCEDVFMPGVIAAAEEAKENAEQVSMGIAHGESHVGINRRELTRDNRVVLGQNPWGVFDPRMTVISFKKANGEMLASMVHYGAHGTAAGTNHEITRDWSGVMTDAVEKAGGGITAFFNSAEGDVGPRLTNLDTVGDLSYVYELGNVAAQDAVDIFRRIYEWRDAALCVTSADIDIPLKPRMTRQAAESGLEKCRGETVNLEGFMCAHFEEILRSYEEDMQDAPYFRFHQSAVRLGNAVFLSFPFELFSEIALRIDREIPDACVLSLSNTNGSEGYFITQDAICRGGYETDMFLYAHLQPYEENADHTLVKASLAHLQGEREEN